MEAAWTAAQAQLPVFNNVVASLPHISHAVQRVGQLDADQLDQDLVLMLKEPFTKALAVLNSSWSVKIDPELVLIIQAILYKWSVWDLGATHGARLQGLRFTTTHSRSKHLSPSRLPRTTLYAHAFLSIILPYLHKRARMFALARAWPDAPVSHIRRRIWDSLTVLETIHGYFSLIGFCLFLYNGRYRTLVDRLLNLKLVAVQQITSRSVSYEFMNRQMVWHAFTEFILFLLPLVNVRVLRRRISSAAMNIHLGSFLPRAFSNSLGITSANFPGVGHKLGSGKYANLPDTQCAICAENASFNVADLNRTLLSVGNDNETYPIQTPYMTSCGHTYCYFCLAQAMLRAADDGEKGWECLRCQAIVHDASRITALTLTEKNRAINGSSGSLDSLDVDGISLDSYDSLRPASSVSVSTSTDG